MENKEYPLWMKDLVEADEYLGLRFSVWADVRRSVSRKVGRQRSSRFQDFSSSELEELRKEVLSCRRCKIASQRRNVVFGEGNPAARIVFVGEAPGEQEDIQSRPFVGRAGQLLTQILDELGSSRQEVFIANVLKCRPPGNRTPRPDEILNCYPFLSRQLRIINPRVVCALGAVAAQTLLKRSNPMSRIRGRFFRKDSFWLIPTYHPAYLLRNPAATDTVRKDINIALRVASGEEPPEELIT